MNILKKNYLQSSMLTARTTPLLMITLIMFLINMHQKKIAGGNHKPQYFEVNIMECSRFKNKVNKTQLPSHKQNYKKTKKFSH